MSIRVGDKSYTSFVPVDYEIEELHPRKSSSVGSFITNPTVQGVALGALLGVAASYVEGNPLTGFGSVIAGGVCGVVFKSVITNSTLQKALVGAGLGIAASYVEKNPLSGLGSAVVGGVSVLALSSLIQGNKAVKEITDDEDDDDELVLDQNHPNSKGYPTIPISAYNTDMARSQRAEQEGLNRNEGWLSQFEDWDEEVVPGGSSSITTPGEDRSLLKPLSLTVPEGGVPTVGGPNSLAARRELVVREEGSDDGFNSSQLCERTVEELHEGLDEKFRNMKKLISSATSKMQLSLEERSDDGSSSSSIELDSLDGSTTNPVVEGEDDPTRFGVSPDDVQQEK